LGNLCNLKTNHRLKNRTTGEKSPNLVTLFGRGPALLTGNTKYEQDSRYVSGGSKISFFETILPDELFLKKDISTDVPSGYKQAGLPDFYWYNLPKTGKYSKWPQNIS
jgi:hypothetical protein